MINSLRIALPEIGQNMSNYVHAIRAAAMDPVVISVRGEQRNEAVLQEYLDYSEFNIEGYDGLLLPGGGDIDPKRYGEEIAGSVMIYDPLDELQFDILHRFVSAGKPVFGICRGMQVINVYFGGTMIQHLEQAARHANEAHTFDMVHFSEASPGSWIARIYDTRLSHNSAHHQGVKCPGRDLIVDSVSEEDHVVEALHHSHLPIYGVQWHPERVMLDFKRPDTVDGLPVLLFFAGICAGEKARRGGAAEQTLPPEADLSGIAGL